MSRTPTLPPDDAKMWRKLIARTHPDAGGDHELFIWTGAVKEAICSGDPQARTRPRPQWPGEPREDVARVPFDAGGDFEECTRTALRMGAVGMEFARVLSLLADCKPIDHLAHEQRRGASYKRLAAIGHIWGMSKAERFRWYRVAEDIPLSDRHAGHILSRLKRRAA